MIGLTPGGSSEQVESFLMARDLYLKPNGALYPSSGKLWFVPMEDKALWTETESKVSAPDPQCHFRALSLTLYIDMHSQAAFFNQRLFGTDFSPLLDAARDEVFCRSSVAYSRSE